MHFVGSELPIQLLNNGTSQCFFCWASAKSNNGCPNLVFVASGKAGPLPDRSSTPWLNAGTQHLCAMNTMILIMILTPNPCCPDTCCQTLRQYHLGVEAVMGAGMVTFAFFCGILESYERRTASQKALHWVKWTEGIVVDMKQR